MIKKWKRRKLNDDKDNEKNIVKKIFVKNQLGLKIFKTFVIIQFRILH
jgi:hypothetical protein